MKIIITIFLASIISGCSTFSQSLTDKNVLRIKQGMKSEEILKMFGSPNEVRQSVCGSATPKPWTCTTWKYKDEWTDQSATFTFSGEPGSYILNDFDIER